MNRFLKLSVLVLSVTAFAPAIPALAQPDAGAKARGDYNFYGRSSGRALRNAREYSQDYYSYAQSAKKVDNEVAKEASDAIGQYIVKSQKHMAWMRKQSAHDKEALASLDQIDKHLVAAGKTHHDMHGLCLKDHVDSAGSMKCCTEINESLGKAIAEHDKLMKRLGLATTPAQPKK